MNPSKKKILDKAFSLFLTQNYDSVSMREIQDAAQISRGAIYHHFKSKEEIYETVVNEYLLPMFSSYMLIPEEEKKTLQATIEASLKYRQSHIATLKEIAASNNKLNDFYFFKFIFQATEHSKEFNEKANLLYEKEFLGWRNVVQTAMRTGEIRPDIDIDFVAQQFVISPFGLGLSMAFNKYVHITTTELRTIYLKLYTLLKKTGYM
ncbi:TetR/AcrR family transcriptional regulator [Dysgonomonas sp. 520]|uniref:TetR/AcrR family transcriptional regulator n=1 Tax=Dysgonomonas sp. 520 TaxID=2302931 RepID=UPI0013D536D5|nr:TetR/AcrR family transcriptional regulator [Dysgonomonas sp. 520]NDW08516.1 TetR/AcrR family transcriptional regulator [Dysgonomonas sp. 520]